MLSPEYNIDHILLPISTGATEAAKSQAKETIHKLRQQAITSGGFSSIQKEIQQSSAEQSPLGWRRANDMPSLFTGMVETMSTGDISEPVLSSSGYHIIQVKKKRGGVDVTVTETHVRHILISPNEIRTMEQSKQIAIGIKSTLDNGGDFIALARKYSDDNGSALSGGDLGWTEPGLLVPEFQKAMDNTAVASISEPVRSQFGWHILEVLGRREKDLSTERAEQQARMAIAETKYDDELNIWLQELRDNAFIEIK